MRAQWENAVQANDTEAAEKWETKVERAEEKVDRAKVELDWAKQEVEKAKEAAKASVPAGRGQAEAFACAVVAALPQGRRAFSCGPTVFAFWGHALLSAARISSSLSFTVLACSTAGSGRGSWLLQANLVCLRVLPMLQNGVPVLGSRWGVHLLAFALALQVAVAVI